MDKVGRFYYIGIDQQYRAKAKKTKEPGCLRTEGTTANEKMLSEGQCESYAILTLMGLDLQA